MQSVMTNRLAVGTRHSVNSWLIILLTAPLPLLLVGFLAFRWYQQKTDLGRLTRDFMRRQNTVLGYDALGVSTGFSDLLEKAARDVQVLALLPPSAEAFLRFHRTQMGSYTRFDTENHAVLTAPLPFFNRLAFLSPDGTRKVLILDGKADTRPLPLAACRKADLCDRGLLDDAVKLPVGGLLYGRILRYYSPVGVPEDDRGASLSVAFRAREGIFVVGIDYLHLKDHLTTPAFPYDSKRDLLQAYHKGNYIYIVDRDRNVISHPYYPNVMGIDRATGDWAVPMRDDGDTGKRPINIAAYRSGKLKEYFARLMLIPFETNGIEIFEAANLAGATRVLSVAPVTLSHGQFKTGQFGHAVVGCNIDYFEAPKERFVPYY